MCVCVYIILYHYIYYTLHSTNTRIEHRKRHRNMWYIYIYIPIWSYMCINHYQPIHAPHEDNPTISEGEMIPCELNWCIPHFWTSPRAIVSTVCLRVLGAGPGQPGNRGKVCTWWASAALRSGCSANLVMSRLKSMDLMQNQTIRV